MQLLTTTSFDNRGIEISAYLPGDSRKGMYASSTHSFELAARRFLKRYRPEVYEEIKPYLFPLSHGERRHR
jgi:hypothetical protein